MSDILNEIDNLPDISFIDGLTLEDIQSPTRGFSVLCSTN